MINMMILLIIILLACCNSLGSVAGDDRTKSKLTNLCNLILILLILLIFGSLSGWLGSCLRMIILDMARIRIFCSRIFWDRGTLS